MVNKEPIGGDNNSKDEEAVGGDANNSPGGHGQVLVKVEAFGVGIHDRYFIPISPAFPYIIGTEGAGVITQLGSEVKNFTIGDRVIFSSILQSQGGAWAEYAAANQETLIHLPEGVSYALGATIPIAGKTALECMRELDLAANFEH